MTRVLKSCVYLSLLLALAVPAIAGETPAADNLNDAITKGQPLLTFRYRYEEVDQANIDNNAHASTLRTTVGYRSGAYKGFSFLVEAENVTVIGDNQAYKNGGYDYLNNGVTDRPVVLDPALTDMNQAYLQWKNAANKAQIGREEIIIGDARFVGNVGWRQHHQAFDAFTYTNTSLDFLALSYRYLNRVQRINGSTADMATNLINADVKLGKIGTLGLYGYLLDYTRSEWYGQSRSTWGAELKGKQALGDKTKLLYELEYAAQSDYADNPRTIEADYFFLMVGAAFEPVTLKFGYEVLGGDAATENNKGAFTTPLATLHKFNGWADKFLATPRAGLEDMYFLASGNIGPVKALGVYHIFSAADGGDGLGTELDLQFTYKTSWKQTFGLKGAFFSTDSSEPVAGQAYSVDTNKIWVFTSYKI